MKPLKHGRVRTELVSNIRAVIEHPGVDFENMVAIAPSGLDRVAGILGGAIVETCRQQGIDAPLFFKYLNHNTFDLTRTLKASGLLDKV